MQQSYTHRLSGSKLPSICNTVFVAHAAQVSLPLDLTAPHTDRSLRVFCISSPRACNTMATAGQIQWGDEPPSDLSMFQLWLNRCSSVTVTPSRVQTKAHGRPTYSLQFFRKTDASVAGPSVSLAVRSSEPRSSLPIFLHYAPICQASEMVSFSAGGSALPWRY